MRTSLFAGLLALFLSPIAPAAETPEAPSDFATGMRLQAPGAQPFYRVELPLAVYAQARPDLGDVRVFNAAGEAVPYALAAPRRDALPAPELQALPLFPLRGTGTADAMSLDLDIRQGRDGRLIALRSTTASAPGGHTVAYLLDLTALRHPAQALRLDWAASPDGYSGEARVEASDDLRAWQVVADAPLLDVRFGGQQLSQKRIALDRPAHRYLRLTSRTALPVLTRVDAELQPGATPSTVLRWHTVTATPGDTPGEYRFDLGARLTAIRLRVALPATNTVAPATFAVRERRRSDWRTVTQATLYRVSQGNGDVQSPALEIPAHAGRYWRLQVDPRAGSLGRDRPRLQVGWEPDQVIFLARGQGPFTLAFGQRGATGRALPVEVLLPGYRPGAEQALPAASPERAEPLGGHDAPAPGEEDRPPADWKRWLLWAILLAGVAALVLMARSLLRQHPSPPAA